MRTPYELRIYSLFAKFRQKNFSTSEGPWGVNFSIIKIFLILCFLWWGPHMNSEYIVCLQNFDKKFFRPPKALGVSIFRSLKFFLILCFLWWGPHRNSEYIVCLQNFDQQFFRPSYQKSQIKKFLNKKAHPLSKNATKRIKQVHIVPIDYQLKKRCFLIKGCAATIFFGTLIFQNINRLSVLTRKPLGRSEVEKIFCRNFANKLDIRSSYGVLITKNTYLEKMLTIEKLTPQGGTLGPSEVEKFFVEILQTNYIFGVHMGSLSQKTQN